MGDVRGSWYHAAVDFSAKRGLSETRKTFVPRALGPDSVLHRTRNRVSRGDITAGERASTRYGTITALPGSPQMYPEIPQNAKGEQSQTLSPWMSKSRTCVLLCCSSCVGCAGG